MHHTSHLYLEVRKLKARRQRLGRAKNITNFDDSELPSSLTTPCLDCPVVDFETGGGNERKRPMYELPDREQLPQ
jgi:hypothetical protein